MPTRFGADGGFASTTSGGVFDSSGNPIISADNEFGAAPLGPAALAQTLFSVPNGTFNILPPDIDIPISNENPLPYWSSPVDDSDGEMIAQVVYNTTSNTYSLRMDPGSALNGDTLSITTRSAVLSDDNLALRQKAIATLEKVGTYAGTTQVNLKLDATYYDHTGTQLSTNPIGTVFDNGTVSSLAEFTTAGTAIVGVSAAYVDLTFTMTATADVTSGIAFDIDTILLQTSQGGGGGGGQSFLITDTFTSSGTWTRPVGVDYLVAVVGISGGGGGGGGAAAMGLLGTATGLIEVRGGGGGAAGRWAILKDVNVAGVATVSIGIGAGGVGGTAGSTSKGTASSTQTTSVGGNGASGGTTTFGTYLTVTGGAAGAAASRGATTGTATTPLWPGTPFAQVGGGFGGDGRNQLGLPGNSPLNTYSQMPYTTAINSPGANGGAGTITGGTGINENSIAGTGGLAGSVGYLGGGGGGAPVLGMVEDILYRNAGNGGGGGGGGGAKLQIFGSAVTWSGTGGVGGAAGTGAAAGGGGGGAILIYGSSASGGTTPGGTVQYRASQGTVIGGAGGNGSAGAVFVIYVG